jgi:hypothetical protein
LFGHLAITVPVSVVDGFEHTSIHIPDFIEADDIFEFVPQTPKDPHEDLLDKEVDAGFLIQGLNLGWRGEDLPEDMPYKVQGEPTEEADVEGRKPGVIPV